MKGYVSNLDANLVEIAPGVMFTTRDATTGILPTGQTGAGKTSALKTIARSYLRANFGGAVWCIKPEEAPDWVELATENGRSNSVVLIGEGGGRFNFVQYLLSKHGFEGLDVVRDCVMNILETSRQAKPGASKSSDPFWEDGTGQLISKTLPILYSATGTVRLPEIVRFTSTAPKSAEQSHDPTWQKQSFFFQMLEKAYRNPVIPIPTDEFEKIGRYWHDEFASMPEKTRGNLLVTLSVSLNRFNSGRLNEIFCTTTTVVPEMMYLGAILIADMPTTTWQEDGIIAQRLLRLVFQRAIMGRNDLPEPLRDRPIFWWSDENQILVSPFDATFHSLCRSSRVCSVVMTQSLPSYHASIGGDAPQAKADQLIGNFGVRLYFTSSCNITNKAASDAIGRSIQLRANYSDSQSTGRSQGMSSGGSTSYGTNSSSGGSTDGKGGESSNWSHGSNSGGGSNWGQNIGANTSQSRSAGAAEVLEAEVEPGFFARGLLTGGPQNNNRVTCVWFAPGRKLTQTGRPWIIARFAQ